MDKSIFFWARERAEFNKSCDATVSGTRWHFPTRPAQGALNRHVDLFFLKE